MNKVRVGLLGAFVLLAVGAGTYAAKYREWVEIPKARDPLVNYLKDPASAQFRNERITPTGVLCGEVNSKNSMGGYVGFKRFILAGPDANYIEDSGPLGKWSTRDLISRLKEENKILRRHIEYRKEFHVTDVPLPSETERRATATKELFEDKWDELCTPSKA